MSTSVRTMQVDGETHLQVGGMTCSACAARLEKALSRATGISDAAVNFALERADVLFDTQQTGLSDIAAVIRSAGFKVSEQAFSFPVEGMTCSACSNRVEKALHKVPGVLEANVNIALERADVLGVAGAVTVDQLAAAVDRAGYHAHIGSTSDQQAEADAQRRLENETQLQRERFMLGLSIALTLPLVGQMVLQFLGFEQLHLMPFAEVLLATPVQFVIGARFYQAAYNAIRARSSNMDVLVVLGTTAAYAYSWYLIGTLGAEAQGQLYFEASAVIITLVLLGKFMEARAKRGTTAAIRQLMELRPEVARIKQADGSQREVHIREVRSGDITVIKPGERIPVDGEVISGQSELDESLLTGESIPVDKGPGDKITGGAINGTGLLEVRATNIGEDSTLSKIIRLVENAQSGKAPVQRLVDRISAVFCADGNYHRCNHVRRLVPGQRQLRKCAGRRRVGTGHRLSVRTGTGDPDGDHDRHRCRCRDPAS